MKRSDHLSVALHVLLHMKAMTSEEMAACMGTHAVVIRRTFAGLREAGIVSSTKRRGGGWRLARSTADISLADIQRALGRRVVAVTGAESRGCLVEKAVLAALDGALREAEHVLGRRLSTITLADLMADVAQLHRHLPLAGDSNAV